MAERADAGGGNLLLENDGEAAPQSGGESDVKRRREIQRSDSEERRSGRRSPFVLLLSVGDVTWSTSWLRAPDLPEAMLAERLPRGTGGCSYRGATTVRRRSIISEGKKLNKVIERKQRRKKKRMEG